MSRATVKGRQVARVVLEMTHVLRLSRSKSFKHHNLQASQVK